MPISALAPCGALDAVAQKRALLERASGWRPSIAMAAKGRLQPVVLNSAPPGRTGDQLTAPILPPRWRRAPL